MLQHLPLRHTWRIAAGHQPQPGCVTLGRWLQVFILGAAQQFQAQTLSRILVARAVKRIGIRRLHQPILRIALEVHPIPGQRFAVSTEHLARTGKRQPQQLVTARLISPLAQQRLQCRRIALIHVQPHQAFTEQVVIGIQRQTRQVQAFCFAVLSLLHGQRSTHRQHLGLLVNVRVGLGRLEQCLDLRPIVQLLGHQQRVDQPQRAAGALPTGNGQLQGASWIAGAVTGDQLRLFVTVQVALERQHFFHRRLQLVVTLQLPRQKGSHTPVILVGDARVICLHDVPGCIVVKQIQVGMNPFDTFCAGQRKTLRHVLINLGLLHELTGVFKVL
ncbi:hypothetical protein D3C73_950160 [compost metagenome]